MSRAPHDAITLDEIERLTGVPRVDRQEAARARQVLVDRAREAMAHNVPMGPSFGAVELRDWSIGEV